MNRTPSRYARGELAVVNDRADLDRSARFWTGALAIPYLVAAASAARITSSPAGVPFSFSNGP
jgi:hypothetical protein